MNGSEMGKSTPQVTPRYIESRIPTIGKSPPNLAYHSHTQHVVTQAYYPTNRSLATLQAMSRSNTRSDKKHPYSTLEVELLATNMIT